MLSTQEHGGKLLNNFFPQWISDFGAISSIVGLGLTFFVLLEAQKIRKSFLHRDRLPKITQEISEITSNISIKLRDWQTDKNPTLEQFAKIKGLLQNIKSKLPTDEKKRINELLKKLQPKQYLVN